MKPNGTLTLLPIASFDSHIDVIQPKVFGAFGNTESFSLGLNKDQLCILYIYMCNDGSTDWGLKRVELLCVIQVNVKVSEVIRGKLSVTTTCCIDIVLTRKTIA